MKKVLLFVAFSAFFANIHAQTSQGSIMVGAGFGFSASNEKNKDGDITSKSSSGNLFLGGGYFVIDKLAVGADLLFGSRSESTGAVGDLEKTTTSTVRITPFARYYFMLDEKFGFFGQLGVPIFGSQTKTEGNKTGSSTGAGLEIKPGLVFFPHPKFGIESSIGLINVINTTDKDKDGNKTGSSSEANVGISTATPLFNLGFRYYIY